MANEGLSAASQQWTSDARAVSGVEGVRPDRSALRGRAIGSR